MRSDFGQNDHTARQPLHSNDQFFHLTAPSNIDSIMRFGLWGARSPRYRETFDSPSIFATTSAETEITDSVAFNQIWLFGELDEYAVIEIAAEGITGDVWADDVAECAAPWQCIIEQEVISPQHLRLLLVRRLDFSDARLQRLRDSIETRRWSAEEWTIATRLDPADVCRQLQYEHITSS